jgi:hypothetical protein
MASRRKPAFRLTKQQQEAFLGHLRAGRQRGAAADLVFGRDDPAIRRKVRDFIDAHPDFEAAVLDAEVEATEHVRGALYRAALEGSVPAAVKWLELAERRDRRLAEPEAELDDFSKFGPDVVRLDARRRS